MIGNWFLTEQVEYSQHYFFLINEIFILGIVNGNTSFQDYKKGLVILKTNIWDLLRVFFFFPESYMKSGRKYSRMQNVINSILYVVYQSTVFNLIELSYLLGKEFFSARCY